MADERDRANALVEHFPQEFNRWVHCACGRECATKENWAAHALANLPRKSSRIDMGGDPETYTQGGDR